MSDPFIQKWHEAVKARDVDQLKAMLKSDCRLISPISRKPVEGADQMAHIFQAILKVLPDIAYTASHSTGGNVFLTFQGHLDGGELLEGIDVFQLDETGLAYELKVFVRPLAAAKAFAEEKEIVQGIGLE